MYIYIYMYKCTHIQYTYRWRTLLSFYGNGLSQRGSKALVRLSCFSLKLSTSSPKRRLPRQVERQIRR